MTGRLPRGFCGKMDTFSHSQWLSPLKQWFGHKSDKQTNSDSQAAPNHLIHKHISMLLYCIYLLAGYLCPSRHRNYNLRFMLVLIINVIKVFCIILTWIHLRLLHISQAVQINDKTVEILWQKQQMFSVGGDARLRWKVIVAHSPNVTTGSWNQTKQICPYVICIQYANIRVQKSLESRV